MSRRAYWLRLLAVAVVGLAAALVGRLPWGEDPAMTSGQGPAVGDPAPQFSLSAADGSEVALEDVTTARPALFYFSMGPG